MKRTLCVPIIWMGVGAVLMFGIAAQGAPVAPDSLTGLRLWLKADAGVNNVFTDNGDGSDDVAATVGQTVAGWQDFSGGNRHALETVEASRPTYQVVGSNSFVRFDGVDDLMERTGLTDTGGSLTNVLGRTAQDETILMAFRVPANFVGGRIWGEYASSSTARYAHQITLFGNTAPTPAATDRKISFDHLQPTGGNFDSVGLVSAEQTIVASLDKAGTSAQWTLIGPDGITVNSGTADLNYSNTNVLNQYILGHRFGSTGYTAMDLGEVIVFDRRLSAEELGGVNDYLVGKYGLPEPGSLMLVGLAAFSWLSRRRGKTA